VPATAELEREFPFTAEDFRYLSELVSDRTGIMFADHKKDMVYARLSRRLRQLGMSSFEQYVRILNGENGESEIGHLINALTTNLTRFFREPQQFDHFAEIALPSCIDFLRAERSSRLRIWSAGCSSGEEPYSIAISLLETPGIKDWNVRVLATDLDTGMLDAAAKGEYESASIKDVSPERRMKHLMPPDSPMRDRWLVTDDLRSLIAFKQLNLIGEWPMTGLFDVIFCRNVMIYFDPETKRTLITRFFDLLRPGGWLYLGSSETLLDLGDRFERAGPTTYRRAL